MSDTQTPTKAEITLEAGEKIVLENKAGDALVSYGIGCGWDFSGAGGVDVDLSVLALDSNGKLIHGTDGLLYYGHKSIFGGAVKHSGDNLTGQGDGDDERVSINSAAIPTECDALLIVTNIYSGASNFGRVKNCYTRIFDAANVNETIKKFDMSEDFSTAKAIICGKIYRHDGTWKFAAIGEGSPKSLTELVNSYK